MIEAQHVTLTGTTVQLVSFTTGQPGPNLSILNAAGTATLWCTYAYGSAPIDPVAYGAGCLRVPANAARDVDLPPSQAPLYVKVLGNANEVTVERRL